MCTSNNFGSLNNTNFFIQLIKKQTNPNSFWFSPKKAVKSKFSRRESSLSPVVTQAIISRAYTKAHHPKMVCFYVLLLMAAAAVSAAGASAGTADAFCAPFLCFVYISGCKPHNGRNDRKSNQIDHRTLLSYPSCRHYRCRLYLVSRVCFAFRHSQITTQTITATAARPGRNPVPTVPRVSRVPTW